MPDEKNNEQRRRKTDSFWGQMRNTITAQLVMTVVIGILLFFSGYQGMQMKVSSLEALNSEQKEAIKELKKDNGSLTNLVTKLDGNINMLTTKIDSIKETQDRMEKDIREMRSEISTIRRGR